MDTVLTVEDVARLLKVKPITVREMLRDQRIRGFKVGKAWRTTEAMLSEDLETISRGETPEPLEAQRVLAAMPKRSRGGRKPKSAEPVPKPEKKRAPRAAVEETTPVEPAAPARKAKEKKSIEDQQLLF